VADEKSQSCLCEYYHTTTGGGFFFVSEDDGQTWHPAMRNMPARLITYSILQDSQTLMSFTWNKFGRVSIDGSRSFLGSSVDRD